MSQSRRTGHLMWHPIVWAMLASASTTFAQTSHEPASADPRGDERKTVAVPVKEVIAAPSGSAPSKGSPSVATPSDTGSGNGATMRTVGLVVGGVGVAGLAVFTITGLMAKSTFNDLQAACPAGCTDASHLGQIDHGKSLQTTANISLGLGLVALGSGALLFLLGQGQRSDTSVSMSLLNGGGMVSYGRGF